MANHPLQSAGRVNKILGKNPGVIILDDITEMPKIGPECVMRARPVTLAIWRLYGTPPIAHHFHEWAVREILTGK